MTMLMKAAFKGWTGLCCALLAHGADPNLTLPFNGVSIMSQMMM